MADTYERHEGERLTALLCGTMREHRRRQRAEMRELRAYLLRNNGAPKGTSAPSHPPERTVEMAVWNPEHSD